MLANVDDQSRGCDAEDASKQEGKLIIAKDRMHYASAKSRGSCPELMGCKNPVLLTYHAWGNLLFDKIAGEAFLFVKTNKSKQSIEVFE